MKQRVETLLPWLRTLVLCLGIVALARPQYGDIEYNVKSLGVDIALVIDVSNSMQERDFRPNRLEAAKEAAIEFVSNRLTDRVSVIVFGEFAGTLCPPTLDMATAERFIGAIYDGIIPNNATAIGDGLGTAVKKMEDSPAKSRVAILLTDGENNTGELTPEQASETAKALGVRVYTIGVGRGASFARSRIPGFNLGIQGGQGFDEETLKKIASETGGKYFHATDEKTLKSIYDEIDRMEKSEIEVDESADMNEQFSFFWFPALALLGLEFILRAFWLRRLP
jgi:Ca-activated chloride channel family protein